MHKFILLFEIDCVNIDFFNFYFLFYLKEKHKEINYDIKKEEKN